MSLVAQSLPIAPACKGGSKAVSYGFIDALRGYAVLLVIVSHTGMHVAELPYPVRTLTNFGWYGVQLFFLMSCVTLLLSWHADRSRGTAKLSFFWLRRVFRIVPMYYAAGVLYFFVTPPELGFDVRQALASALFVNDWHPDLMPTVAHQWSVVPGGWSVGVEFTFYILFPFFAAVASTWRRAALLVVAAFAVAYVSTIIAEPRLLPHYGKTATETFLFYWFPHQLPVFALGALLYYGLKATWEAPEAAASRFLHRHGVWVVIGCVALCMVIAELPFPGRMPPVAPLYVPRPYAAALAFALFALCLGNAGANVLDNRWIRSLGRVSFSAYLLHFAVLIGLSTALPTVFDTSVTGVGAIWTFLKLLTFAVPITYGLAMVTFTLVEQPMVKAGRRLASRRRSRPGDLPAPRAP